MHSQYCIGDVYVWMCLYFMHKCVKCAFIIGWLRVFHRRSHFLPSVYFFKASRLRC